jgi:plasmid stabilization system protein ParE
MADPKEDKKKSANEELARSAEKAERKLERQSGRTIKKGVERLQDVAERAIRSGEPKERLARPEEFQRQDERVPHLEDDGAARRAMERQAQGYTDDLKEMVRGAGDPSKRGTVDRIEGDFAVVEDANGNFVNVPLRLLPEGIREGSPAEWKE